MKKTILKIVTIGVCVATIGLAPTAHAQSSPPREGGHHPGGKGHHGGKGSGMHHDPAQHLKVLTEKLGLSNDQQNALKPILADLGAQRKAIHDDTALTKKQRHEKMKALHEATKAKINAVLTPEQQKTFAEMKPPHPPGPPHPHDGENPGPKGEDGPPSGSPPPDE